MIRSQTGNALFLILIAVALFAALSYAITQSSRGSTNIDAEKALLEEGLTQQCEAAVNYALKRVQILNRCRAHEISYELADNSNANPDAPSDESCHLFRPSGGGIAACGAYLEPLVTTGTLSVDDTTTIGLTAGGTYFRCAGWSGRQCWNIEMGVTGTDFWGASSVCTYKGSGIDGNPFRDVNVGNQFCDAACGGTAESTHTSYGTITHYWEDDTSLSEYTGQCMAALSRVTCSCW